MDLKKYLGDAWQYLAPAGLAIKDPFWGFITIISIFIISKIYGIIMRNHRIISDKYIDDNGNPRETTYSDKH